MNWLLFALLGLVLGSFFNVCIWRLPRGESISYPPSHCPHCKKRIRAYDNIPVVSYLFLRGRCRDCHQPISVQYPLVEAGTALLFVLAYARFGFELPVLRALIFIGFLMVLAGIDISHQLLPVQLSFAGLIIGLLTALLPVFRTGIKPAVLGALIGAGFVFFAWALWRFVLARPFARMGVRQKEAMGWGDLPFAAMVGVYTGPKGMVVALGVAVVTGVLFGLGGRVAGRLRKGQEVPFGPFLALGGLVGLFWGEQVFNWYLKMVLP
ncbi:MAG: prepilin peptidase [candidate division WOR-3 bacterium]